MSIQYTELTKDNTVEVTINVVVENCSSVKCAIDKIVEYCIPKQSLCRLASREHGHGHYVRECNGSYVSVEDAMKQEYCPHCGSRKLYDENLIAYQTTTGWIFQKK